MMRVSWTARREFIESQTFLARSDDFVASFTRLLYFAKRTASTTRLAVVTAAANPTTTSSIRTKAA